MTVDLAQVPFPDDTGASAEEADAQPRARHGTFALDPDPFGPPFEPLPDNAQVLVSAGPRATILVHPDDVLSLSPHSDPRRLNGCCWLDGLDGLNLVCGGCGAEIATEQSDCESSAGAPTDRSRTAPFSPHFQCVLTREGNLDALTVRVEHLEHTTTATAEAAGRHLAELVKRTIGVTIGVEVTEPGSIERSVGKMKRTVDIRPPR